MRETEEARFLRGIAEAESLAAKPSEEMYYDWGYALLALHRYSEASNIFTRHLEEYPDDSCRNEVLYHFGLALIGEKSFENAIERLKECVELSPEFSDAHASLGDACRMSGMREMARQAYRDAIAQSLPGEESLVQAEEGLALLT